MVSQTPDPPREESAITENENIQMVLSTDSEGEDDNAYDGYEMLATDVNDSEDFCQVPEEDIIEAIAFQSSQQQQTSSLNDEVVEELIEIWSNPSSQQQETMDPQLKDEVLKAMKNFSLPASSIPQWAKDVGEEDWKRHLLDKIRDNSQ